MIDPVSAMGYFRSDVPHIPGVLERSGRESVRTAEKKKNHADGGVKQQALSLYAQTRRHAYQVTLIIEQLRPLPMPMSAT
jgi:hypothetical protein